MPLKMIKRALIGLGLVCLSTSNAAFAGPFEKYFQASPAEVISATFPSKTEPQIRVSSDYQNDVRRLTENGYVMIGASNFEGSIEDPKKAKRQAKKIKAEIVLYASSYRGTRSGAVPLMVPNNTTTNVNGNVFGSGGWGGFSGTKNTIGTTPVLVPVSFDRYDQIAGYFSKIKPEFIGLGMYFDWLKPDQAAALGTNKAMLVDIVVRNSPAFDADILSGDILLTLAGQDVSSLERLSKVQTDFANQSVEAKIIRNGVAKTLQIVIAPPPPLVPRK
jgi:hypothetical protein